MFEKNSNAGNAKASKCLCCIRKKPQNQLLLQKCKNLHFDTQHYRKYKKILEI